MSFALLLLICDRQDWDIIFMVHVRGAYSVTKASGSSRVTGLHIGSSEGGSMTSATRGCQGQLRGSIEGLDHISYPPEHQQGLEPLGEDVDG